MKGRPALANSFIPTSFILLLFKDNSVSLSRSDDFAKILQPIGPSSLSSMFE